jgi:metal-dependent amidase/aminoacylase/carboxypeptidase family protein
VRIRRDYPVTVNDPALTEAMLPTLARVAGPGRLVVAPKLMGSEDFSFLQQRAPGLFFYVGCGVDAAAGAEPPAPNHSPRFQVDERALPVGVRALAHVACDWLAVQARV